MLATSRGLGDRIAAFHGPALWTIAGFVPYVVGGMASLLLVAWLPIGAVAGSFNLSVQNGLHNLAWGGVVVAAAVPLGRRLVAGLRFGIGGWVLLLAGLVLAAVATTLMNEFVRARYVWYDPEYAGLSLFTGPALVAIALATWAALATPREGSLIPGVAALTAIVGMAMSLLPSVPGAADGIVADSVPLVATYLVAAGYAAVAGALVLRHVIARNVAA